MLPAIETIKAIESTHPRSKWGQGVKQTALDMLEPFRDETMPKRFADRRKMMLNGARDWESCIYGGCGLVYNRDIAERFSRLLKCASTCGLAMMLRWRGMAKRCSTCTCGQSDMLKF